MKPFEAFQGRAFDSSPRPRMNRSRRKELVGRLKSAALEALRRHHWDAAAPWSTVKAGGARGPVD